MAVRSRLFVGITTSNSATMLPHCLVSLRATTDARATRLVVFDNCSQDATVSIAKEQGAEVISRNGGQAAALGDLFNLSQSEYTLLIHADVVFLDPDWVDICTRQLQDRVALLSPEDIGCGPYTRPWGQGKPESSFLLFRTSLARSTRITLWRQRFKLRLPYRSLDFSGDHITYNLPERLAKRRLDWRSMEVLVSEPVSQPIYTPPFDAPGWKPELAMYRYGLGNFYRIDGIVTHYHNWYERGLEAVADNSDRRLPDHAGGLPLAFLQRYTKSFLRDLEHDAVVLPT